MAIISGTLLALKAAGSLMAKKTAATAAKGAIKAKAKGALKTKIKGKVKSIAKDKLLGRGGGSGGGSGLVKRASIGSALTKTETTNTVKQEANLARSGGSSLLNEVIEIKITTIQIKDLLASNLAKQKAADAAARKQAEKDRKAAKEDALESGSGGGKGGMKMPKGPKVGPFEAIKRFLLMTFLGSLLAFLLKHHKKVLAVFNFLTKNISATIKVFLALRKAFRLAVKQVVKGIGKLTKFIVKGTFNIIGKVLKKTGIIILDTFKVAAEALYNFLKATIEAAIKFAKEVAKGVSKLGKEFLKRGAQVARYLKRVYRAASGAIKGGKGVKGAVDAVKVATSRSAKAAAKRAAQEAAEKAAKEAGEKLAKEATEKIAQEAAEKLAKEAAEEGTEAIVKKVTQEAAEKVAQEAAEKIAQEAAEKVAQEAAEKIAQEAAEKVAQKGVEKLGKSTLSRIPFLGGLITCIVSLASGEPVSQALFKTAGAVLGGFLGSFIPIPIIGTLIGEILGEYVGDLFYTGLMGGGMDAVGKKLQEDIKAMLEVGGAIKNWIGDGFSRLNDGIPSTFGVKNYLVILNPIESVPLFYRAFFTRDSMSKKEEKEPKVEQKFLGGVVNAAKSFLGVSSKEGEESGSISTSGIVKEPKKLPGISLTKIPLKNQETYLGIRYKNNVFSKGLGSIFGGIKNIVTGGGEGGQASGSGSMGSGGPIITGSDFESTLAKLLKNYEGLRTQAYLDSVGIPTIGMGATYYPKGFRLSGNVQMGQTITEEEALFIKQQHIKEHRDRLLRELPSSTYNKVPDNVKAALESKVFNYGSLGGTLTKLVTTAAENGNYKPVSDYFRNSLARHNGGINSWRRNDEAGIIDTGTSSRARLSFPKQSGSVATEKYKSEIAKATDPSTESSKDVERKATPDNNDKSTSKDKLPGSGKETSDSILIDPSKPPSIQNIIHPDLMAGGTFGGGFNMGGVTRSDSKGETSKPKPSMMKIGSGSGPKIARSPNVVPRETASFGSINVKNYQIQESAHYDEPSAQIIIMPPPQQSSPPQRRLASNTGKSNGVPPLFTLNRDINDIVSQAAFY